MTGPIRDTHAEREYDSYVESPTRANKTAVEVYVGNPGDISGGGGGSATSTIEEQEVQTAELQEINSNLIAQSSELEIQTLEIINIKNNTTPNLFSIPTNSDTVLRSVSGSVETFEYKSGGEFGTLLKTVTLTYAEAALKNLVKVEVT